MPSLTKIPLTASTHGRGIKVGATVIGSGTTIHTAAATTEDGKGDDIVLYASNHHDADVDLTIGFGGTTDPDDLIPVPLAAGAQSVALPGLLLRNGLVVKAAASVADVVTIHGYAMRAA
jgi:hypothetical protein